MITRGTSFASESMLAAATAALECLPTMEMRTALKVEGVALPAGEELSQLSSRYNAWLEAARYRESRETHSWYNMFTDLDEDNDGAITFDEFQRATRSRLKVPKSELGESELRALWCALDVDNSNQIQPAELSAFLRLPLRTNTAGAPDKAAGTRQASVGGSGKSGLTSASELAAASTALATRKTGEMRAELDARGVVLNGDDTGALASRFNEWFEAARLRELRPASHTFANLFADLVGNPAARSRGWGEAPRALHLQTSCQPRGHAHVLVQRGVPPRYLSVHMHMY